MRSSGAVSAFVLLLLLFASTSEAVVSCSDVIKDLRPCISYLSGSSGKPPPACCAGAKALASAAPTSQDKKVACNCIKSAAKSVTINAQLAQALPSNCGINLSVSVSPNTDCSKVG